MIKYTKMKTLFKLTPSDAQGKRWSATNGEILPETAALHYLPIEDLIFTEKIDGTNMGIKINDNIVEHIQKRNNICNEADKGDNFYFETGNIIVSNIEEKKIEQLNHVIIYGELCGAKIQKGGNYFSDRRFIVFDIYNILEDKFFTWDAVKYFANELNIQTVPEIIYNKDNLSVDNVKDFIMNQKSVFNPEFGAEGAVIRYKNDTCSSRRWMAKIRKKDFR